MGMEVGGTTAVLLHLQRMLQHEAKLFNTLICLSTLEIKAVGEFTVHTALPQTNHIAHVRSQDFDQKIL